MDMATDWSAILLAGGRSTRMGRDKALLDWRGRPLIEHMIDLLHGAGAARVLVSGDRPGYAGIPDARPGSGPVGGIAAVIDACADGCVVVVPVDLPTLRAARIEALTAALAHYHAAAFAAHPLPCALRIDLETRAVIQALAAQAGQGASVRGLLERLGAVELAVGDASDLRPCNTPADFAALAS